MITKNDFDHDLIIQKYNELKEKHPEFDERQLLEEVFSSLSKDFSFPETMSKTVDKKKIIKKCKDCKKEKEVYYKGKDFYLCEECYKKREKHYVEVYDSKENIKIEREEEDWGDEILRILSIKKDGKEIAGISYTYLKKNNELIDKPYTDVQIENFDVKPEYQGKGYASLLLKEALLEIDKKGWTVQLGATFSGVLAGGKGLSRQELINFYKRYGFEEASQETIEYYKKQEIPINMNPQTQIEMFRKKKGKGWFGESERHSKARKFGKADTLDMVLFNIAQEFEYTKDFIESLTHDEAVPVRYVPSKIPSGQTRLQKLWEQQKAFERAKRLGKEIGVEPLVGGVESVTVPFSITNTQTGVTMKGEVVENLEKNTKQLTPLSSSNARASGQFGSELLVQFHPSKLTPIRTYRYMFETPEQAKEANEALQKSGSPGRWIWQNLRGHIAGEKVTASKVATSLVPPNQGLPTIGGTTASLVPYKISNRVPVSRVKNFNEILKEMKRTSPNPTTNPQTGSRLESLLGTRKELRELRNKNFRRGTYGLPPVGDFEYVGNLDELEEDYKVKGHYRYLKSGEKIWIRRHTRGEGKSIIDEKERLTSSYAQWKHERSMDIPIWRKIKRYKKKSLELLEKIYKSIDDRDYKKKELFLKKKEYYDRLIDELQTYNQFSTNLFEDNSKIKYEFDITLHNKIKIAKGIGIMRYPIKDLINVINNTYYDLPNTLKETIKEVRIFEKANDDPTFGRLEGCGGFYHPINKTITIGCKTKRKSLISYSKNFVKEAVFHEAGHSLDFQRLNQKEQSDLLQFFTINYPRLNNRGEYASTDKMEFFAEGYAKLSMGDHNWFRGLRKGTKQFFKDIMQKYDFFKMNNIMLNEDINEKNNGIKFSYTNEDGIHIFGFYQIPEDISLIEAEMMVEEGKAQFENIDKYINKEVKNDKKGNKENMS